MTKGTSNKTGVLKVVLCAILAAASVAGLAGCPEGPGGRGTIQQQSEPQQGQNNLPKQTVTTPAK